MIVVLFFYMKLFLNLYKSKLLERTKFICHTINNLKTQKPKSFLKYQRAEIQLSNSDKNPGWTETFNSYSILFLWFLFVCLFFFFLPSIIFLNKFDFHWKEDNLCGDEIEYMPSIKCSLQVKRQIRKGTEKGAKEALLFKFFF